MQKATYKSPIASWSPPPRRARRRPTRPSINWAAARARVYNVAYRTLLGLVLGYLLFLAVTVWESLADGGPDWGALLCPGARERKVVCIEPGRDGWDNVGWGGPGWEKDEWTDSKSGAVW